VFTDERVETLFRVKSPREFHISSSFSPRVTLHRVTRVAVTVNYVFGVNNQAATEIKRQHVSRSLLMYLLNFVDLAQDQPWDDRIRVLFIDT